MEYTLRDVFEKDLPSINKIKNYYIENTISNLAYVSYTMEEELDHYNHIVGKYPYIVAQVSGVVVGYGYVGPFRAKDGYNQTGEVSVYLDKDFLRHGIGRALLEKVIIKSKEYPLHTLVSVISAENKVSVDLHKKCGFTLDGIIKEAGYKENRYLDVAFLSLLV